MHLNYLHLTPLELDELVTNMVPLQEIEIPYSTEVYSNFIEENDLTFYKNLSNNLNNMAGLKILKVLKIFIGRINKQS